MKTLLNELFVVGDFKRPFVKGNLFLKNKFAKTFDQFFVNYIGGYYKSPKPKNDVEVIIFDGGLLFSHIPDRNADIIYLENIKSAELMTEVEVQNNETLARRLLFGDLARALKKRKATLQTYLILECEVDEIPFTMAFTGKDIHLMYASVIKKINQ